MTGPHRSIGLAIAALLLGACAVGPDYQRPDLDLPSTHRVELAQGEGRALADIAWFDLFEDAELRQLIDAALARTLNLREALGRILEASDRARLAGAGPYPTIAASVNSTPSPGAGSSDTSYSAGLAFGWELDLFGKLRSASAAARAELLATEEGSRAVMVSLVAGVASTYYRIRELDRRIAIVERTIESQADSLVLVRDLKDSGVVSAAEENQARSLLASSRARLPGLQRDRIIAENALALLLGLSPQPLVSAPDRHLAPTLPPFQLGLPSDLLSGRPDIRAAERRLQAATERVGIAIANRFPFPTIGFSTFVGRIATPIGDLVDGGTDVLSWGPVASVPILDFGRSRAAVGIADAQLIQATERYKSAVMGALRELADAAAGFEAAGTIIEFTGQRAEAAAEVLRLQRQRFRQGVVAYLEVLDAERQLLAAELELSQAEFGRVQRFIELYRTLGGGADEQRLADSLDRLRQQAELPGLGTTD
mgnify:FL=1